MVESEYVNLIKETINEVANDYKNDNEVDSVLLWDTMKLQIRSSSLHYAKKKKAKMKSQETSLEVDILARQRKLEENNFSETEKTDILNELDVKSHTQLFSSYMRRSRPPYLADFAEIWLEVLF